MCVRSRMIDSRQVETGMSSGKLVMVRKMARSVGWCGANRMWATMSLKLT